MGRLGRQPARISSGSSSGSGRLGSRRFGGARLAGGRLAGARLSCGRLASCRFGGGRFGGMRLTSGRLASTRLGGGRFGCRRLASCRFGGGRFGGGRFGGGRLGGGRLGGGRLASPGIISMTVANRQRFQIYNTRHAPLSILQRLGLFSPCQQSTVRRKQIKRHQDMCWACLLGSIPSTSMTTTWSLLAGSKSSRAKPSTFTPSPSKSSKPPMLVSNSEIQG